MAQIQPLHFPLVSQHCNTTQSRHGHTGEKHTPSSPCTSAPWPFLSEFSHSPSKCISFCHGTTFSGSQSGSRRGHNCSRRWRRVSGSWRVWLTFVLVPRWTYLQRFRDIITPSFCGTEWLSRRVVVTADCLLINAWQTRIPLSNYRLQSVEFWVQKR